MCPFISSITTSDMPIHIPSKYHHFILRDTTYQMKYLIPKTANAPEIRQKIKSNKICKQYTVNYYITQFCMKLFHATCLTAALKTFRINVMSN